MGLLSNMGIDKNQLGAILPFRKKKQAAGAFPGEFNEDLADFVNNEYMKRQVERKPWELQWRLNLEFMQGNQYLDIDTTTMSIIEIPKLWWYQEREIFNQIAPIMETRISRMSQTEPIPKVRPASSDDSDISSARVESMLLQSAWSDQKMDVVYNYLISWMEIHGTAFLKTTWNKNRGRVIGQVDMGAYNNPNPSGVGDDGTAQGYDDTVTFTAQEESEFQDEGGNLTDVREGDIETTVVPAYEIFPDSCWRDDLELCRSIIHARAYHVDEIEEMWGVRVDAEDVDVMTLQRMNSGLGGLGYGTGVFKTATTRLKGHAVLKEYYERPSKKYPQGRYIVVAGKKCLHAGPMPYRIGDDGEVEFPFERFISGHHPGCFWGKSVIERMIPIQRRYNALRNRKAEYLNLVTIGQWYEPMGSIEDDSELNNAPGNRIRYRPGANGAKPEPVEFPSLPTSFEDEINTLLNEFTAISGVSELTRMSEAPAGVKSGVALNIAQSQDDTRVSSVTARVANGIVGMAKKWIRLYRQFVQEPRLLRSVGDQYDVEVKDWEQSDLKSDDVIIENAAAMQETPAQRRSMVFNLLAAGLFNDPDTGKLTVEGRMKVFELLEFGNWESTSDDDKYLQRSRARRENKLIMQGNQQLMPSVMDFDDHAMHILQHNRERMLPEYDELLKTLVGPLVDQMMRMHIAQHLQAMIQQAQAGGMVAPLMPQRPEDMILSQQSYQSTAADQQNTQAQTQQMQMMAAMQQLEQRLEAAGQAYPQNGGAQGAGAQAYQQNPTAPGMTPVQWGMTPGLNGKL